MIDGTIELTVNGAPRSANAEVRMTLADFLREKLELTINLLDETVAAAVTKLPFFNPPRKTA